MNKKILDVASILIVGCKHNFNDIGIEFLPDWQEDSFERINHNYEKYTYLPFRGYKVSRCIYCGLLQKVSTGMTTNLPINPSKIQKQVLSMNIAKKKNWVGIDLGEGESRHVENIINVDDINK